MWAQSSRLNLTQLNNEIFFFLWTLIKNIHSWLVLWKAIRFISSLYKHICSNPSLYWHRKQMWYFIPSFLSSASGRDHETDTQDRWRRQGTFFFFSQYYSAFTKNNKPSLYFVIENNNSHLHRKRQSPPLWHKSMTKRQKAAKVSKTSVWTRLPFTKHPQVREENQPLICRNQFSVIVLTDAPLHVLSVILCDQLVSRIHLEDFSLLHHHQLHTLCLTHVFVDELLLLIPPLSRYAAAASSVSSAR